jgi:hypothetical protein
VPEPVNVWLVPLGRNNQEEVPGRLSLEPPALVFDVHDGGVETLPLTQIKKVARVHGSPILMLTHLADGEMLRTAFYFTKPPPVPTRRNTTVDTVDASPPPGLTGMLRRSGKRRTQRANAGYLTGSNAKKKELVMEWTVAVRTAVREVNG